MTLQTATGYAERFLRSYPGVAPGRRIENYAKRIARFDENVAHEALEFLLEHAKHCPSIAEMLDELHRRAPQTERHITTYPPGLHPDAESYTLNGQTYVRVTDRERRLYREAEARNLAEVNTKRGPKTREAIDASRAAARSWMRAMLRQNPGRTCDKCKQPVGGLTNLSGFIERCAMARYGDLIDGRLVCDGCEDGPGTSGKAPRSDADAEDMRG